MATSYDRTRFPFADTAQPAGVSFITTDTGSYEVRKVKMAGTVRELLCFKDVLAALERSQTIPSSRDLKRVPPGCMFYSPAGVLKGPGGEGAVLITKEGLRPFVEHCQQHNREAVLAWIDGVEYMPKTTEELPYFTSTPQERLVAQLRAEVAELKALARSHGLTLPADSGRLTEAV